jgi:2-polyprenyl-3-methyl-5-hydroxy-6-metoxy-1,4-benzoquinol methylase
MRDSILDQQIEYYRARAQEYEETALPREADSTETPSNPMAREWQDAERAVRALPQYKSILELACGTGLWTRELAKHTEHLAALDAAPEMLELNRAGVNDARVKYECVNLFEWEPTGQYDLVFFAFWLSHVPEARLDGFLERVKRAVKPDGQVYILDEPRDTKNVIPTVENTQARTLNDGRTFTIVKEYYDPQALGARMKKLGFYSVEIDRGDFFFHLRAFSNG